jgi:hypothetical protein
MDNETQDASFFSSDNVDAARQRDKLAFGVLDHLLDWLGNLISYCSLVSTPAQPWSRMMTIMVVMNREWW